MKLKTHKGANKRFRISGRGKILRRKSGQDHFNSRERQKIGKWKRTDEVVTAANPRIRELMPYK